MESNLQGIDPYLARVRRTVAGYAVRNHADLNRKLAIEVPNPKAA